MLWTCVARRPNFSRSSRALRRHNLGARAPQSRRVDNRRPLIANEHCSCLLLCVGPGIQMAVIVECQDEQLHTACKCCEPHTAPSLLDCLFSCFRAGRLVCIPLAPCFAACGFPAGRACRPAAAPDCNCSHCCRSCFAACLSPAAASKLAQAASNGACCGSTAPDSQSTDTLHQAGVVDTDGRSSPWTTGPSQQALQRSVSSLVERMSSAVTPTAALEEAPRLVVVPCCNLQQRPLQQQRRIPARTPTQLVAISIALINVACTR